MRLSRRLLLGLVGIALVVLVPGLLSAQQGSSLRVGDHVRIVRFDEARPFTGTLTLVDTTALEVLESSGASFSIPIAEIQVVERRLCYGCSAVNAVTIGAAVGFLGVGSFAALVAHGLCESTDCNEVGAFFIGGLIGLAPGAALGGIVGATTTRERWEVIPINLGRNVTLGIAPARRGRTTLGLRLRL